MIKRWIILMVGLSILAILFLAGFVTLPDIQAEQFGSGIITAIVMLVILLIPLTLTLGVISLLVNDFVVPIMYKREIRVLEAIAWVRWEIIKGNVGAIILYCLMKFVLGIVGGTIVVLLGFMTCCIGFLPYVSSVLSLPVTVFFLCYPLYFLRQFGEQYPFFADEVPPPSPAPPQ